jgi:hypothetical protein
VFARVNICSCDSHSYLPVLSAFVFFPASSSGIVTFLFPYTLVVGQLGTDSNSNSHFRFRLNCCWALRVLTHWTHGHFRISRLHSVTVCMCIHPKIWIPESAFITLGNHVMSQEHISTVYGINHPICITITTASGIYEAKL